MVQTESERKKMYKYKILVDKSLEMWPENNKIYLFFLYLTALLQLQRLITSNDRKIIIDVE
jgi:hypothetical protein